MSTDQNKLQLAIRHHQAGDLPRAEALYREILTTEPRNADALHLLGVLAGQNKRSDEAVDLIRQALEVRPNFADAMCNLGNALRDKGLQDEAVAWYQKAIALTPDLPEAWVNLGHSLRNLGNVDEAIIHYRRAIALMPGFALAHDSLGIALRQIGDVDAAIACHRRAIALRPNDAKAHTHLGNSLHNQMHLREAVASYRRAISLKPDLVETYAALGSALRELGELEEAVATCRSAIALDPSYASAHNDLGNALKDGGRLDEAISAYREAVRLAPECAAFASNLIMALHYHPASTSQGLYDECLRWASSHAAPLKQLIDRHANDRDPNRRLRIGYVSPDLGQHVVSVFFFPLLISHDRENVEIFCYADVRAPDEMTRRVRDFSDHWRSIVGRTDEQVCETILADKIDILVDLSLHTAHNRLLVFARKPAPVQVTYLAYCSTSGISAIDYRLTDPYLDPPESPTSYYSEKSIHLPETYWCYQSNPKAPEPGPPPSLSKRYITFGSLNNFCKTSKPALGLWCELLRGVPNSRLVLHAKKGDHCQRVLDALAREGIAADRLRFVGHLPVSQYFKEYQGIDIGLDPFPYSGGTTTCDTLWMGVPVVTPAGQTAVGRGGVSILSNVGLPELVARTPEQYLRIAVDLANDLPRLSQLRASLRPRLLESPLMDAPRFTRNLEAAYRSMWRNWCAG